MNETPSMPLDSAIYEAISAAKPLIREAEMAARKNSLRQLFAAWRDADSQSAPRTARLEYDPFHQPLTKRLFLLTVGSDAVIDDAEKCPPLTTPQLLAISVLADDDPRAAAALADYLQEQGVDAISEARRLEREHVAATFDALAAWHDEHGSDSLAWDYQGVAGLIRDPQFDDAVRLNEEERLRQRSTRDYEDAANGHDSRFGSSVE